ncbi:hypothetical protein VTO73DRAFT_10565 [Trametes versicolor]
MATADSIVTDSGPCKDPWQSRYPQAQLSKVPSVSDQAASNRLISRPSCAQSNRHYLAGASVSTAPSCDVDVAGARTVSFSSSRTIDSVWHRRMATQRQEALRPPRPLLQPPGPNCGSSPVGLEHCAPQQASARPDVYQTSFSAELCASYVRRAPAGHSMRHARLNGSTKVSHRRPVSTPPAEHPLCRRRLPALNERESSYGIGAMPLSCLRARRAPLYWTTGALEEALSIERALCDSSQLSRLSYSPSTVPLYSCFDMTPTRSFRIAHRNMRRMLSRERFLAQQARPHVPASPPGTICPISRVDWGPARRVSQTNTLPVI